MNLLILAPAFPHAAYPYSGLFNERCSMALLPLCSAVEVVVPRPYVPPLLARFNQRWRTYDAAPKYEKRGGMSISRLPYLQIPRWEGAILKDLGAFLALRRRVGEMHRVSAFDAILSFDLRGTGGIAWRLGDELGIPVTGWAFGDDVRVSRRSSWGHALVRSLERLDLVFYQSQELLEKAAQLLGLTPMELSAEKHIVLSHGIPSPPKIVRAAVRARIRQELGITDGQVLAVSIGRIVRDKGIFELLDALSLISESKPEIVLALVGSVEGFDETADVRSKLEETRSIRRLVQIVPMCAPDRVWEYLCAADMFVFASHNEGMPNSVLEAMAMEVPVVSFAIPPVEEIDAGGGILVSVPPFDPRLFAKAMLTLAVSPGERRRLGMAGRARVAEAFSVERNMATAYRALASLVESRRLLPMPVPSRSHG